MSAALVPLEPRPSKTDETFAAIQKLIHRHTTAETSTYELLMRRVALAREFVRLQAEAVLSGEYEKPDSDTLYGLLELLSQIRDGLGDLELAFTTISNQIHLVQRPELAKY